MRSRRFCHWIWLSWGPNLRSILPKEFSTWKWHSMLRRNMELNCSRTRMAESWKWLELREIERIRITCRGRQGSCSAGFLCMWGGSLAWKSCWILSADNTIERQLGFMKQRKDLWWLLKLSDSRTKDSGRATSLKREWWSSQEPGMSKRRSSRPISSLALAINTPVGLNIS